MNWTRFHEQSIDAAKRLGQARLADAGHVLDQQVTFGEQRHHGELDRVALAVHDGGDVADHTLEEGREAGGRRRDVRHGIEG